MAEKSDFFSRWEPIIKKQGEEMAARRRAKKVCPKCGSEMKEVRGAVVVDGVVYPPMIVCPNLKCGHEEKVKEDDSDGL